MTASADNLLVVLRHSPYGSSLARSGVDIALAAAAFEHPVSVLLSGPGVLQLAQNQHGEALGRKTLGKQLASLPLYDIETVYADAKSLAAHGIDAAQAPLPVTPLDEDAIGTLLNSHRHVLGL